MGPVIGDILPLAIGIAISPIPIIAAILMLLSPKASRTGVSFLIGWVAGIVVTVTAFTLLSALIPSGDPEQSAPIAGVLKLVLGALLLLLAVRQWRSRPAPGTAAVLPQWMSAIDTMTAGRAFLLAFLLASVNPKNLLLGMSAGLTIGSAGLSPSHEFLAIAIFSMLAAATVAVPVVAYLAAAQRMRAPLESLRTWLVAHNATVMSVVFLILGADVIGKGIASF